MNKHLNIFRTYTNVYRTYQLENDLTRAFAITLQEDLLFLHEVIKHVLKGTLLENNFFESLDVNDKIHIEIQKKTSLINDFDYIFAISLSEHEILNFWSQNNHHDYDPICDLVIRINKVIFVVEAKRDNFNCTSQLFNQIYNIVGGDSSDFNELNYKDVIIPVDLSWPKLMLIATKVIHFEKYNDNVNRFLDDFVELVKSHNYSWVPEVSMNSLFKDNKQAIERRLESAIFETTKKVHEIRRLEYSDRSGFIFNKSWAQELLMRINSEGNLLVAIYPANTKSQGYNVFRENFKFSNELEIMQQKYSLTKSYHIKFTSFQRYFTGLWFKDNDLKKELITSENFDKYTGRKKRGKDWDNIVQLFDDSFNFDWKKKCDWEKKILNSGKSQFNISFGYEFVLEIPFAVLKEIDQESSDLSGLVKLLIDIYYSFMNKLLIQKGRTTT